MPGTLNKVKWYSILGGNAMNLFTYNGLTRCKFKTWEDQKECTLEGVEKTKYHDRCLWLWTDDETCTNPDAIKKE